MVNTVTGQRKPSDEYNKDPLPADCDFGYRSEQRIAAKVCAMFFERPVFNVRSAALITLQAR